jgi:hypothetical protein
MRQREIQEGERDIRDVQEESQQHQEANGSSEDSYEKKRKEEEEMWNNLALSVERQRDQGPENEIQEEEGVNRVMQREGQEQKDPNEALQIKINSKKRRREVNKKKCRKIEEKFNKILKKTSKHEVPTLQSLGRQMIQEHQVIKMKKEIKRILNETHLDNLTVNKVIKELKKIFPTKLIEEKRGLIKRRISRLSEKINREGGQQ